MKFTKKAFRKALKENNQTQVWYLASIKFGRTPTKREVDDLVFQIANTQRDEFKATKMAYSSYRKTLLNIKMDRARYENQLRSHRIPGTWLGNIDYRLMALRLLRRLHEEPLSPYTKIPMFGFTHLYFCSPSYGHQDYNKVRTCWLNGPLATDNNGNRYDPQAAWCTRVRDLGQRIYEKKLNERNLEQAV